MADLKPKKQSWYPAGFNKEMVDRGEAEESKNHQDPQFDDDWQ